MHAIIRRLVQLIVVLVVVTFFTSILTSLLPGDPVTTIAPFSSAQTRADIRKQLGLNENIVVRYGKWLGKFVTGDMGREYAGTDIRGASISVKPDANELDEITKLIEAKKIKPVVTEVLPLTEAVKALQQAATHHTRGKIVLKIAEEPQAK